MSSFSIKTTHPSLATNPPPQEITPTNIAEFLKSTSTTNSLPTFQAPKQVPVIPGAFSIKPSGDVTADYM
jgi:hypothetical protein